MMYLIFCDFNGHYKCRKVHVNICENSVCFCVYHKCPKISHTKVSEKKKKKCHIQTVDLDQTAPEGAL